MSKPVELLGQGRGVEEKIAPETGFFKWIFGQYLKHFSLIKKLKKSKKIVKYRFNQVKVFPKWYHS